MKLHPLLKKIKRQILPLTFHQENFHGGYQYLAVWRFGRVRWEVYDWGANTGSGDLERHLRPLQMGTLGCYLRIQNCRQAGLCRLVGIFPSWKEARSAAFKRESPIPSDAMELSAFLLNEKLAAPGSRVHAVLVQCQQTIMGLKNDLKEQISTFAEIIAKTEEALELGLWAQEGHDWADPNASIETLPESARRIREERDELRRKMSHKHATK